MPYLDENLEPTKEAITLVRAGQLYVEKREQEWVMVDKRQMQEVKEQPSNLSPLITQRETRLQEKEPEAINPTNQRDTIGNSDRQQDNQTLDDSQANIEEAGMEKTQEQSQAALSTIPNAIPTQHGKEIVDQWLQQDGKIAEAQRQKALYSIRAIKYNTDFLSPDDDTTVIKGTEADKETLQLVDELDLPQNFKTLFHALPHEQTFPLFYAEHNTDTFGTPCVDYGKTQTEEARYLSFTSLTPDFSEGYLCVSGGNTTFQQRFHVAGDKVELSKELVPIDEWTVLVPHQEEMKIARKKASKMKDDTARVNRINKELEKYGLQLTNDLFDYGYLGSGVCIEKDYKIVGTAIDKVGDMKSNQYNPDMRSRKYMYANENMTEFLSAIHKAQEQTKEQSNSEEVQNMELPYRIYQVEDVDTPQKALNAVKSGLEYDKAKGILVDTDHIFDKVNEALREKNREKNKAWEDTITAFVEDDQRQLFSKIKAEHPNGFGNKEGNITVSFNEAQHGIEVRSRERLTGEQENALTQHGFKWSNNKQLWYAKQDNADAINWTVNQFHNNAIAPRELDVPDKNISNITAHSKPDISNKDVPKIAAIFEDPKQNVPNIKLGVTRLSNAKKMAYMEELQKNGWRYAHSFDKWYPQTQKALNSCYAFARAFVARVNKAEEYSGIKFFDQHYNESEELCKYINAYQEAGKPPVALEDVKAVTTALNRRAQTRIGIDKDKHIVIVSTDKGKETTQKVSLDELFTTAKTIVKEEISGFQKLLDKDTTEGYFGMFVEQFTSIIKELKEAEVKIDNVCKERNITETPNQTKGKQQLHPFGYALPTKSEPEVIVTQLGKGVCGITPVSYLAIEPSLAKVFTHEVRALLVQRDGKLTVNEKKNEKYVMKELIDKGICPMTNKEYYAEICESIKMHPLKYAALSENTAENFKRNLIDMARIDNSSNLLATGQKLIQMATKDEQKAIGQWLKGQLKESGYANPDTKDKHKQQEAMNKLFMSWRPNHGTTQKKTANRAEETQRSER